MKYKRNLEDRTFQFALDVRRFFKDFDLRFFNLDDVKQVIRSSGSIGANYIEANEKLGRKDFVMRIRISKKEAKETIYWLKLIQKTSNNKSTELAYLITECLEIQNILGAIYKKVK